MRLAAKLPVCLFLLAVACSGGGDDATPAPDECAPGAASCACLPSGGCDDALVCVAGTCGAPVCRDGTEGCACLDGACGNTTGGEPLACMDDVCQLAACPAGNAGCACLGGASCSGDAICVDGKCRAQSCIPGSAGCECLVGSCDRGLACNSGVCEDLTGRIGGACYDDGTCTTNARCDSTVHPAICVFCELGEIGCQCDAGDSCLPGLSCLMGHCSGDPEIQNRAVPEDPQCHTPCSGDVTLSDGTVLNCDSDGLLAGCLDGRVCEAGQCIEEGSTRRICLADAECPDFMQCIQGYCYSNCETDADCEGGLGCHLKVCRQPCTAGEGDCPDSMICDAPDTALGYCVARPSPSGNTNQVEPGTIGLGTTQLSYSNVELTREVRIINASDSFVAATFTKLDHVLVDDTGATESTRYDATCTAASCPMWWMEFGPTGNLVQGTEVQVSIPPNCDADNSCPRLTVRIAPPGVDAVRWRGTIRMSSPLGTQDITLSYVSRPEGQWAGRMVYFANFDDEGIDSRNGRRGWLDRVRSNIDGAGAQDIEVTNGLIKRWGAFRNGNLGGGWPEMAAVLQATESEQWRWPTVVEDCFVVGGACYLFSDGSVGGLPRPYVTNVAAEPIPTGSSEFPMAFNLYTPDPSEPTVLEGRVVSEAALHYPGSPKVELRFSADPSDEASCDANVNGHCVVFLQTATSASEPDGLMLDLDVGGRYLKQPGQSCAAGFVERRLPWLVPGFERGTAIHSGFVKQVWCVDYRLPDYASPVENILEETRVENRSLARGNPIPDGQVIRREVRLLDGAMIDNTRIFLLFRERYPSFLGGEELAAYGYMVLERRPVDIDRTDDNANGVPDDYEGAAAAPSLPSGVAAPSAQCSADLLAELGVGSIHTGNVHAVIADLIDGGTGIQLDYPTGDATGCSATTEEEVHYYCEETGLFDGGPENLSCWGAGGHTNSDACGLAPNGACNDGGAGSVDSRCGMGTDATDCGNRYVDTRLPCPLESDVVFFTAPASRHAQIVGHACQDTGTCGTTLSTWAGSGSVVVQVNPTWNCIGGAASCDEDPLDRRAGKEFYQANSSNVSFTAMRPSIADAFRYRTRFVNRDGSELGFTPSICQPVSSSVPYCYDPEAIEELRERTDCLLWIYESYFADPTSGRSDPTLFTYLEENFAESDPAANGVRTGFEKYYAELLIMLGDQAYTNAFESRFDLAGVGTAGFAGDEFEPGGIAVSGIAGFEMHTLHQAVQYYSIALDRFYAMSSVIASSLDSGTVQSDRNFLSSGTVTIYFDRLIRASTQRSRAWAEIARRYQGFNRPDLARRVATRAYNATYLESIALTNTILRMYDLSQGANRPQLVIELENAQRRYSMALLDLANVYQSITDATNILGFAPDYVPFPALGTGGANVDINAFERIYQFTQSKLEAARRREEAALAQTREYDSDDASFQAEITRLSRTYEQQLSEMCGLFTAPSGDVYPAIRQYAYLDDVYALYGDPCGFVGNGNIHQAIVNLDIARVDLNRALAEQSNHKQRIEIQRQRVDDVCEITDGLAQMRFENAGRIFDLDQQLVRNQERTERAQRVSETANTIAQTLVCDIQTCIPSAVAAATIFASSAASLVYTVYQQEQAEQLREDKAALESATARTEGLAQCEIAQAELEWEVRSMMLTLQELELSVIAAHLRVNLAISEIAKLRQQAQRVQLEMEEAIGLAVNVQAARSNPNVRIYRNDAVLNAELTFQDALKEAYRLTLVYEYYTSQSYAARDQLFLTRMVSFGDYNLENYVADLYNAFLAFEEVYGNPDLRVQQLSLVDDVFRIPRVDESGAPLSADARAARMRALLLDPQYLNRDGYIAVPFSTRLTEVSPVTRNHKIFYVEANLEGNDNGDFIGRVYLKQRGTSTIHNIGGDSSFYRFPNRTAVINPAFNAQRPVELSQATEVYRSYRLRDLPLVNDHWELIFNHRDEAANLDINLAELTDIKLYVFYTDFTVY